MFFIIDWFSGWSGLQSGSAFFNDCLIDEIIKDAGFELIESDINGFQVDFWNTYKKNDKVFVLSGSLYYGDFKLTKKEDEMS